MNHNETLNTVFNCATEDNDEPTTKQGDLITRSGEVIVPVNETVEQNVDYDYERTRNNLHSLLDQGQTALFHALEVAKQSEHPRAFEVVGNLVKQLADVNHQLIDLSEKRQRLSQKEKADSSANKQTITNNAIFVGSTADLNKMLKDALNNGA